MGQLHLNQLGSSPEEALKLALAIVDESRSIILQSLKRPLSVESKADGSLVSTVDRAVEELARDRISKAMSYAGVLGEEYGHSLPEAEFQWVIDPIDGTSDFVRGIPLFGTVLALFKDKQPVTGVLDFPMLNERYWAALGLGAYRNGERINVDQSQPRRSPIIAASAPISLSHSGLSYEPFDRLRGSFPDLRIYWTCYSQATAASGQFDASVELNLHLWDVAASPILCSEAGREFRWLVPPSPWESGWCSAVLGDPRLVAQIAELLSGCRLSKPTES